MRKVRDHNHLTGNYRGAAHVFCNLNYRIPRFIPVLFHNLGSYEAHLFIKEFNGDNQKIILIPNNEEKYISSSNILSYQSSACVKNKCLNKLCEKSKKVGEKFNKNKESVYLEYLDANNLYGWAMSQ
jgi:hypothetical protein